MRRFLAELLRRQDGGAAVEFAIFAPLLFAVLAGIGLFTLEMGARNKARDAVNAGSLYVMQGGQSPAAIRDVMLAAWRGAPGGLDVSVEQYCLCGTQVLACPTTCSGEPAPRFTRLQARGSIVDSSGQQTGSYTAQNVVRTR
jgi:Flp pilus assembly protein TadG